MKIQAISREKCELFVQLSALLGLVALCGMGCASHLHNPANQTLAQKAQEQLNALSRTNEVAFENMISNVVTISKLTSELNERMTASAAQIYARKVTETNWQAVRESLGLENPLLDLSRRLEAKKGEIDNGLKQVRGLSKEALMKFAETKSELIAAKSTVSSWNRRVAVLDKIIESTPSIKDALQKVESSDDLKTRVEVYAQVLRQTVGDQKVVYADADGNSQTNDLTSEIKTMFEAASFSIDSDDVGKIFKGLGTVFNPKAPGLVITAASLARDLAESESARLSIQLNALENRLRWLDEAEAAIKVGLKSSKQALASIPKERFPDNGVVKDTLIAMANAERPNKAEMGTALNALSDYVKIHAFTVSFIEDTFLYDAQEQHLESIRVSKVNFRQQEAMAARGIESLLVYHNGGMKPEELADIAFKVVQLGVLSWIGAGIK